MAAKAGAFVGPLTLSRLRSRHRHASFVFGALSLRGAVDLILTSVDALPAALVALVAYGPGISTGNVSFSSLIQTHVPDEQGGRVFSAFGLVWHSARLVSIAIGGSLLLLAALSGIGVMKRRPVHEL